MPLSAEARRRLSRGQSVAAELPAQRPGYRRFIMVRSFREGWSTEPGYRDRPWQYRAYEYELKAELLLDDYPGFEVVDDFRDVWPDTLDALERVLEQWAPGVEFRDNREVGAPM